MLVVGFKAAWYIYLPNSIAIVGRAVAILQSHSTVRHVLSLFGGGVCAHGGIQRLNGAWKEETREDSPPVLGRSPPLGAALGAVDRRLRAVAAYRRLLGLLLAQEPPD